MADAVANLTDPELFDIFAPMSKEPKSFTPNEVAALVEELKSEFRAVVEVVAPLPNRLDKVEERLAVVETEVRSLKDVIGIALPSLTRRVDKLEAKVGF